MIFLIQISFVISCSTIVLVALVQDSEVLAGAIIWSFGLFLVGFIARYSLDSEACIFRLYSELFFGIIVMAYHAYSDM